MSAKSAPLSILDEVRAGTKSGLILHVCTDFHEAVTPFTISPCREFGRRVSVKKLFLSLAEAKEFEGVTVLAPLAVKCWLSF